MRGLGCFHKHDEEHSEEQHEEAHEEHSEEQHEVAHIEDGRGEKSCEEWETSSSS